jgi:hypothetical protein
MTFKNVFFFFVNRNRDFIRRKNSEISDIEIENTMFVIRLSQRLSPKYFDFLQFLKPQQKLLPDSWFNLNQFIRKKFVASFVYKVLKLNLISNLSYLLVNSTFEFPVFVNWMTNKLPAYWNWRNWNSSLIVFRLNLDKLKVRNLDLNWGMNIQTRTMFAWLDKTNI